MKSLEAKVTSGRGGLQRRSQSPWWRRRWWLLSIVTVLVIAGSTLTWNLVTAAPEAPVDPPEMGKILKAQEQTGNFGILIPAYLPKGFDRAGAYVNVTKEASGVPAVDLTYSTRDGASIYMHQWVPANPAMETLSGSRIIETKWGKGYLLTQGLDGLIALWVDIGPLRISLSSVDRGIVSREQLVQVGNTLGLASNLQVSSFVTELPQIKDIVPPPPFEVKPNAQGVQELNLIITPGGYTPMRFAVTKGVPVKITFRAMGQVGCGNTLIFPTDPQNKASLTLKTPEDSKVLEFTPPAAGEFQFECTSNCYRGVMTVREAK
jgi:hypothetical protein